MNPRAPSLRLRLCLWLAAGFTVVLGCAGAGIGRAVTGALVAEFDADLLRRAQQLATLTEQENGAIEFDYVARFQPEFERSELPDYFQFWLGDGQLLLRSRHLDGDLLEAPLAEGGPAVVPAVLANGRRVRIARFGYVPRTPDEDPEVVHGTAEAEPGAAGARLSLVLALARGTERLDALLAQVWGGIALGVAVAVGCALMLVWRFVQRGLRPLRELARQVRALGPERLDARVALADPPRELLPIAAQVNGFAERLEQAVLRERRFAGNVAHELRTPVAELRNLATVGARWPDDAAAVRAFFGDVQQVAGRMEGVIGDLLLLARCHGGHEPVGRAAVAVRPALVAAWTAGQQLAAQRGLSLVLQVDDGLCIATDPGKFAIVCGNLVGNAIAHALPGGPVAIAARLDGERFELEVANAAAPLAADELARLCEPFWQRDAARGSAGHAGLGLALVAALARLLQFETRFTQDADGTFRARLCGPRGAVPALVAVPPIRPVPEPAAPRLQGEAS